MKLKKIKLERYKKINSAEFNLEGVNVIVGANNSGKSSLLQGIHFSITAAIVARQQGTKTFSSDLLLYNPTPDFSVLRNSGAYLNQTGTGDSKLELFREIQGNDAITEMVSYSITLYKGRNYGNVGCSREGDYPRLGADITDHTKLFSIYVPGLAGIAQHEELKSKAIIKRGAASGDANLYLRNIIFYINKSNKLNELNTLLATIFPTLSIEVEFDEEQDHRLQVFVNSQNDRYPIELSGTGLLQAIQIYSYVVYFSPKILLLDEPDSHLHPDNQITLCKSIINISEVRDCQILLCTHSRHVVDAMSDQANFIWMKNGSIQETGTNIEKLSLLLDLGALDDFDKLRAGQITLIVLTEDSNKEFLRFLLEQNGFDMRATIVYSYRTSSNIESAILFVGFLENISTGCKVLIHRDRDFMTQVEVNSIECSIRNANAIPFITKGSDIESYFIDPIHISEVCEISIEEANQWLLDVARENQTKMTMDFSAKREAIKNTLYRSNRQDCPEIDTLFGTNFPPIREYWKGKFILKKIRGTMQERINRNQNLLAPSNALTCPILRAAKTVAESNRNEAVPLDE